MFSEWSDHELGKKIKRESAAAAADRMTAARRSCSLPAGAGATAAAGAGPGSALNTITPCAACKLLRRRCAQECPFSPYFSPLEPHKFAAVHKVFGASNVSKMLLVRPSTISAMACLLVETSLGTDFFELILYETDLVAYFDG